MIKHLAIPALMVAALCLTTTPAWSDKGHKGKDEKCDVADLVKDAKVTIDGQPQNINGQVVCATAGGNYNIAIGEAATGIAVVMAPDASVVHSVGLGNVNGVTLGYQEGVPGGAAATATKDGNNIKVSGTATGIDMANPMAPVTKPFEIEVTCP